MNSNIRIRIIEAPDEIEVFHKRKGNLKLKLSSFVKLRLYGLEIYATKSNKCFSLCCVNFGLRLLGISDTRDWAKNNLAQVIVIFWPENCAEVIEN